MLYMLLIIAYFVLLVRFQMYFNYLLLSKTVKMIEKISRFNYHYILRKLNALITVIRVILITKTNISLTDLKSTQTTILILTVYTSTAL